MESVEIHKKFSAKNKFGSEKVDYKIQNLHEESFDEALELLRRNFVTDETICVAKNISKSEAVLDEVCYFWRKRMERKLSFGCFLNDESNELVGVSVMSVLGKGEKYDVKAVETESRELLGMLDWLHKQYDVFEKDNVDKYLTSHVLCVKKEFRKRGIARELMKIRPEIMKKLNLKLTSTAYTVAATQKLAREFGHWEGLVIPFEEIQAKFPSFDFSKRNTDYFKIMNFNV